MSNLQEEIKDNQEIFLVELVYRLIHDKKVSNSFMKEFAFLLPELENEILTFSIDQNCSCREKIRAYVYVYREKVTNFIIEYGNKNSVTDYVTEVWNKILDEEGKKIAEAMEHNIPEELKLNGKIAKTTMKDWKQFAEEIRTTGLRHNGFSVVKEGDDLLVFFL